MKNENKLLIITFIFFSFILLLVSGTYAFFSYSKLGTISSGMTTNGIKFNYAEGNSSIGLTDTMPMSDEMGKNQNNYFEFDISSKTDANIEVPYDITLRNGQNNSDIKDAIKVYLTEVVPKDDLQGILHMVERDNSYSACVTRRDRLNANEKYQAECYNEFPKNSIADRNLYSLYMQASDGMTESQCNNIIRENQDDKIACIKKNNSYYVYSTNYLYDDIESCEGYRRYVNSEYDSFCDVKYPTGYQFDKDTYKLDILLTLSLDGCRAKDEQTSGVYSCQEYGTHNGEKELLLTTFDQLPLYSGNRKDNLLFSSAIAANTNKTTKYRLRMWIDSKTDFANSKYNNATFTSSVNVYANGKEK